MTAPLAPDAQAALMAEGDRLARALAQTLEAGAADQPRLVFLGRSLALNLVNAFLPTVEHVTGRAGQRLHAVLDVDERGRAVIQTVTADGEAARRVPVDDLLQALLFRHGRLHPAVQAELQGAVTGSEHHATRALVSCLRQKAVLDAMGRQIREVMRVEGRA